MGRPRGRAAAATGRPAMRSPGWPPVARREHRQRFWACRPRSERGGFVRLAECRPQTSSHTVAAFLPLALASARNAVSAHEARPRGLVLKGGMHPRRVIVTIHEVATKPSRTKTNTLPFKKGSRRHGLTAQVAVSSRKSSHSAQGWIEPTSSSPARAQGSSPRRRRISSSSGASTHAASAGRLPAGRRPG